MLDKIGLRINKTSKLNRNLTNEMKSVTFEDDNQAIRHKSVLKKNS